jgi:hypothetical protein
VCQRFNQAKKSYEISIGILEKIDSNFIAWFVGFWEGEGCVSLYKKIYKKNKIYEDYSLSVSQKEKDILFKIKNTFKFGNVYELGLKNVCSEWCTHNVGEIIALAKFMLPLIKSPRRKMQLIKILNQKRIKYIRKRL